jgi:GTP-binding protein EngB required for normal cell division
MMRLRSVHQGVLCCQRRLGHNKVCIRPAASAVRLGGSSTHLSTRASSTLAYPLGMKSEMAAVRSFSSRRGWSEEGRNSQGGSASSGRSVGTASSRIPHSRHSSDRDSRADSDRSSSQGWGDGAGRARGRRGRDEPRWGNMDSRAAPRVQRSGVGGSAAEGRVVLHEDTIPRASKHGATSQMCVGCGTEVRAGISEGMVAGAEAVDIGQNKKMAKNARYINTTDANLGTFLCHRCASLQSGDIWSAYDALRDVSPQVFKEQLKHIVSRRKFGFCILVVDATDPEHTAVRNLRQCVGSTPVLLVLNKIDLLPRMTDGDRFALQSKIQQTGLQFVNSFAVSATTGEGLDELARNICENLDGSDVFVVGAANVGKSSFVRKLATLLSKEEYLKGGKRAAKRRRDSVEKLKVTGSNLPGTTLQAVRIPCFPSDQHALWDTPGIINGRALQYGIFPSHLMEPLTRPGSIAVPTHENGLDILMSPGQSMLIEADWMHEADDDEEQCVLGRLDFVDAVSQVRAQAYLHPSLRIRIVPTAEAPAHATIPSSHIEIVNHRIRKATGNNETGLRNSYSYPLMPYIAPERPTGELSPGKQEYHAKAGRYYMDISFASLGWISLSDTAQFSTIPHCVKDSIFSKRRALYPTHLKEWLEDPKSC